MGSREGLVGVKGADRSDYQSDYLLLSDSAVTNFSACQMVNYFYFTILHCGPD